MDRGVARRGEIWEIRFDPVAAREQGGQRPGLIISSDIFNVGPRELVIAIPVTTRDRGVRNHVRFNPPEGGATGPSFVVCEQIRAISAQRLLRRRGVVEPETLAEVERRLKILLDLP